MVPQLIAAFERKDEFTRYHVARALGAIGPDASAAVPALVKALEDDLLQENIDRTTLAVAEALAAIGHPSEAAISALTLIVARAKPGNGLGPWCNEVDAATALGRFGGHARNAVPILTTTATRDELSAYIRCAAASALGEVAAPGDQEVVSALRKAAQIESGWAGVDDGDDVPGGEEASVRIAAALALWKIAQDPRVVAWLCVPLRYPKMPFYLRNQAARALAEIGPAAAAAVPTLITMVTNWERRNWAEHCSLAAVVALGRIGKKAESAVPVLVRQLSVRNPAWMMQAAAQQRR